MKMKPLLLLVLCIISLKSTESFQPLSRARVVLNHQISNAERAPFQRKIEREATSLEVAEDENSKKAKMTQAYNVCTYTLGGTSAIILFMTDKTNNRLLAKKVAGAVGFGLASAVSYILAGANDHDRLGSDTYKRLNIGLLGFATLGLFALPGEAAFLPNFGSFTVLVTAIALVKALVGIVAFDGWKRGVGLETSLIREMFEGTKSTLAGLWFTKKRGAAYRNPLVLVIDGLISSFFEGCFFLTNNMPKLETSLWWSAVSRLFLITTMMYSLKDAAERDRLAGTTFIQMNFMIFIWLFTVGIAQGLSVGEPFMLNKASLLPFSVPFLIETGRYQNEKKTQDKSLK
jgi:hypothetical protein